MVWTSVSDGQESVRSHYCGLLKYLLRGQFEVMLHQWSHTVCVIMPAKRKKIIALDTKGPEIRTGLLKGVDSRSKLSLDKGAETKIITDDAFKE